MGQAYRLGRGVLVDLSAAQSWLARAAEKGPCRRSGDAWASALPERQSGRRAALAERRCRKRRCPRHAGLRHGAVQRRQRHAGPGAGLRLCQPLRRTGTGAGEKHARADGRDHAASPTQEGRGAGDAEGKDAAASRSRSPRPRQRDQHDKPAAKSPATSPPQAAVGASSWAHFPTIVGGSSFRRLSGSAPVAGRQPYLSQPEPSLAFRSAPTPASRAAAAACSALSARGKPASPSRRSRLRRNPVSAANALRPKQGVEAVIVEPRIRDFGQCGLRTVGDAQTGLLRP